MNPEYVPAAIRLTEDDVKHRFLPFLKDFYRKRYEPLPNSFTVDFDNVAEGGVVADGIVQFRKTDGSLFTCAYEATSRDKTGEVKFTLNIYYFLWDCAAFGAVCAALVYVFYFRSDFLWLVKLRSPGNIGMVLGALLIGFLGWYFTMQRWKKYRFIHAIAQFETYQADEQWIALAEDVFPSPVDPYRMELREQCVYHGYGLAIVPAEGKVQPLVAPSRLGIYAEDRKMVHWVTRAQWYQQTARGFSPLMNMRPPGQLNTLWNRLSRAVQFYVIQPFAKHFWSVLTKPLHQSSTAYTRFMRGRVIQKWIFGVAIGLVILLMSKVLSVREEEIATLEQLHAYTQKENPEDEAGYVLDGDPIPFNAHPPGVPKQYPLMVEKEADVPTLDLSGEAEADDTPTITLSSASDEENTGIEDEPAPKPKPKPSAKPAPKTAASPATSPCGAYAGRKGWVIQESAFDLKANALARQKRLSEKDIAAQLLPRSCLQSGAKGWVLLLGTLQPSAAAAAQKEADWRKIYQKTGLGKANLLVKKVN